MKLSIPVLMSVDEQIPGERGDFVGLNYYANLLIDPFMKREPPFEAHKRPGQVLTDMPYTIYAEGLWRALHRLSRVGLPIYITENGLPDDGTTAADVIRGVPLRHAEAADEGVDVRGFYYWSFMDNIEWA